jgi:formyl-CoA transferase
MLASPLRLQGTPPRRPSAPPLLGQDTRAVLNEVLGFTPQELDRLVADHVVADLESGAAKQV